MRHLLLSQLFQIGKPNLIKYLSMRLSIDLSIGLVMRLLIGLVIGLSNLIPRKIIIFI